MGAARAASHRAEFGPLILSTGLMLIIIVLSVLPPLATVSTAATELHAYPQEPAVRVLVERVKAGHDVSFLKSLRLAHEGSTHLLAGPDSLRPTSAGTVRVGNEEFRLPARLEPVDDAMHLLGRVYGGTMEILAEGEDTLLVNHVSLESYVLAVITAEMGPSFPDEALRAQAIATRSYAAYRMGHRRNALFDVRDDQRAQVYRGRPASSARLERLVESTRGRVLTFQDEILEAVFSSTCGGETRPAGEAFGGDTLPPLRGVPCSWCEHSPHASWTARGPASRVGRDLGLGENVRKVESLVFSDTGRLQNVTISGARRTKTVGVSDLRRTLKGAKSTWIVAAEVADGEVVVRGRGFGHGVGLCQFGAGGLARAGRKGEEILAHYYPGAGAALLYPVTR